MNDISHEAALIAYLNDTLRQHHICGQTILSDMVLALPKDTRYLILELIRRFNDFNPRNDPQGWHDFGSVEVEGEFYYFVMEQAISRKKRVLARIMRVLHSSEYPAIEPK